MPTQDGQAWIGRTPQGSSGGRNAGVGLVAAGVDAGCMVDVFMVERQRQRQDP